MTHSFQPSALQLLLLNGPTCPSQLVCQFEGCGFSLVTHKFKILKALSFGVLALSPRRCPTNPICSTGAFIVSAATRLTSPKLTCRGGSPVAGNPPMTHILLCSPNDPEGWWWMKDSSRSGTWHLYTFAFVGMPHWPTPSFPVRGNAPPQSELQAYKPMKPRSTPVDGSIPTLIAMTPFFLSP